LRRRFHDHACLAAIQRSRNWLCSGALSDAAKELQRETTDPETHRGNDSGVTFLSPQFASSGNQAARAKVEISGPKQTSTGTTPPASAYSPADPMQQWAAEELERIWPHLESGATSAWERLARFAGFLAPEDAARVDGLR